MLNILLSGCYGKLSRAVIEYAERHSGDVRILGGIDPAPPHKPLPFPVFAAPGAVSGIRPDVILDCSLPQALPALLEYAVREQLPLVIATTGYSAAEFSMLADAAKRIPVFHSGNMSLGIFVLKELVRQAACVLGESFDIEVVEAHHNQKIDAPSGTAYILAEAVNQGLAAPRDYTYERHSLHAPRPKDEIGVHSIRGGTICGEHTVIFAGFDEVIELTHRAYSKNIFAAGCVCAARFMAEGKAPGRYGMEHIVNPCFDCEGEA